MSCCSLFVLREIVLDFVLFNLQACMHEQVLPRCARTQTYDVLRLENVRRECRRLAMPKAGVIALRCSVAGGMVARHAPTGPPTAQIKVVLRATL